MSAVEDTTDTAVLGFDQHTAVEDDLIGPWRAEVAPELSGFAGAHGGYLAAIALRALGRAVADPQRTPRSLTVHLLAAVAPGALDLHPRLERAGSTMSAASLRIERDGATVATALGSFGAPRESLAHAGVEMPEVPAPEQCREIVEKPVAQARVGLLIEHRPAAPPLPLSGGDRAEILVWMRLREDRPIDALSACMLADAAPPALYGRLRSYVAMPSTDITVHFADLAAGERGTWVLGVFRTRTAAGGYAVEDGELWSADACLLLSSRQQRRVLGDGSPSTG
jgi:acyl-CoA thioesterase